MKHLKLFEEVKEYPKTYAWENREDPEVGDYIIANVNFVNIAETNLINNSIGILIEIDNNSEFPFNVRYHIPNKKMFDDDISIILENGELDEYLDTDEILYWSKDKRELEIILQTKKYNL